ncbi:MAG: MBL fold metallo-hydrolase [Anaerolineales bacterium]|nr:MBL fold metallo-hydrolase [Anaerolineales bacterium]
MDITWYGHSCFRLTERGLATVITDPFDANAIGYQPLKLKGDVVTISHDSPGHNNLAAVPGYQYVLAGPGEYEVGGVFITGASMYDKKNENPRRNVIYVMDFGGLTVAHLGDLNHIPNQSEVDALGNIDVVLIPVGGGAGLHATQAAEVISLLEPSIVVPMHYQTQWTTLELDPVDRFLKEMGVSTPVEDEVLRVSSSGLPEQTQIVVLSVKE